jgi:hypothetical protein
MPIKQTIPTNSGDYVQFGNATTPVAAQVGGYEDSTGNGHLELYTTASGTVTEQVRVTSAGKVGIGTSSPANVLDVVQNINADTTLRVYNANSNVTAATIFVDAANSTGANYNAIGCRNAGTEMWKIGGLGTANSIGFATGSSSTERMRIDSSGNVLVGKTSASTTTAGVQLTASGTAAFTFDTTGDGPLTQFVDPNASTPNGFRFLSFRWGASATEIGTITKSSASAVAYNTTSDYRLKENVMPMTGALEKVALLKPVTYTWKADGSDGQGFIAHELQAVVPDCVTGEKDAVDADGNPQYQGIDTSFLVATLTAAIQELNAKVTALEAQLGAK